MSALAPFHAALFARLRDDAGLAAYQHASMAAETPARSGVSTYDHVPKMGRYPYIAIESHTEGRVGIFGGAGYDDTAQLGVWDNYNGKERVLEVLALISAAIETPLAVAGFGTMRAKLDLATVLRDPSGLTHGIYRVRKVNLA